MKQLIEFTFTHIVFYLAITHITLRHNQLDSKDAQQVWMLFNLAFIGIHWISHRFPHLLLFSLQHCQQYILYSLFPLTATIPPMLTSALISPGYSIINYLITGMSFVHWNDIKSITIYLTLLTITIIRYVVSIIKSNSTHSIDQQSYIGQQKQLLNSLPFPYFIIDPQSNIIKSNNQATQFLMDYTLEAVDNKFKNIFQQPDQFLALLQSELQSNVVQLTTQHVSRIRLGSAINVDLLGKTIQKQNYLQTISNIWGNVVTNQQSNDIQNRQIFTLYITDIVINHSKMFMVSININQSFLQLKSLQKVQMAQIKTNALKLLNSLQSDYKKWDNMRTLYIIKESDLKLLSNAIVHLYFLILQLQVYDITTSYISQSNKISFNFKHLITYILEIFAGKYLNLFDLINVYLDESMPNEMNGSVANFQVLMACIFELIAAYSSKNNTLNIQCNLQQVANNKSAYLIQIQILWHLNPELDLIFREALNEQNISDDLPQQTRRYLETILKLQDIEEMHIQYKEQPQMSEIQLVCEFQLVEQYPYGDKDDSHSVHIFKAPQLQITFCRTQVNDNHIQWKQKVHSMLVLDKSRALAPQPKLNYVNPRFNVLKKQNQGNGLVQSEPAKRRHSLVSPLHDEMERRNIKIQKLISDKVAKMEPQLMVKLQELLKEKLNQQQDQFEQITFGDKDSESELSKDEINEYTELQDEMMHMLHSQKQQPHEPAQLSRNFSTPNSQYMRRFLKQTKLTTRKISIDVQHSNSNSQ